MQTPFVTILFRTLGASGKGVSEKAFCAEVPWGDPFLSQRQEVVRPEKWGHSQVGFRGSNASSGRIVLLPCAFWAHGASKMATLGASLLPCILQCFRA